MHNKKNKYVSKRTFQYGSTNLLNERIARLRVDERRGARKNFVTLPIKNSYFKYTISSDYLFKASTFVQIELYIPTRKN